MPDVTSMEENLYLTILLDNEFLALEVAQVREVQDMCPITRVPNTLKYMRGVINLRGSVIPVIDLRLKFGLSATKETIDSRIVVIEINLDESETVVGMLSDSVHDVIDIADDQIDTSPLMGDQWRTDFIRGIGKHNDQFILMLDINRVFSATESPSISGTD